MGKKGKGFHTPFSQLKHVKIEPPPKPAPPVEPPKPPVDEQQLFEQEMSGVARLERDPRGRLGAPAPSVRPAGERRVREDAEAYAALAELVSGDAHFDISDSDEYIEGLAEGIDRRLLRKLRKGDFAVQAHIDLHGLVSEEARVEVEQFLESARRSGRRCVLIVHGRGLHSKESVPVLKERLKVWLTRGRIGKLVLAFASARPADGGTGALYVLLRK